MINRKMINRINILGIHGAGKTYLAKLLSKKLGCPFYSLNEFKYVVKYSKKRPVSEVKKL